MLQSIMSDPDAEVARRVLIKHNNDIEAAASAILEGDRGEVQSTWSNTRETIDLTESGPLNASHRPNTPLAPEANTNSSVPLLAEPYDSDFNRALQMSLETNQNPNFRKTDRAPDPNWAVVPSNVSGPIPTLWTFFICGLYRYQQPTYRSKRISL